MEERKYHSIDVSVMIQLSLKVRMNSRGHRMIWPIALSAAADTVAGHSCRDMREQKQGISAMLNDLLIS